MFLVPKSFTKDQLKVRIFQSSKETGEAAAEFVELQLKEAIQLKGFANLVLGTGASQFSFLEALKEKQIELELLTNGKIQIFV